MVERASQSQEESKEFSYIQQSKIIVMRDALRAPFKAAVLAGKEKQSKRFPVICFLGVTGHGKSSTANSVCGEDLFTTSAGTESETSSFDVFATFW
jgi:hypothetical protein